MKFLRRRRATTDSAPQAPEPATLSLDQMRLAMNSLPMGVVIVSVDGKIVNFGIPVLVVSDLPKSST